MPLVCSIFYFAKSGFSAWLFFPLSKSDDNIKQDRKRKKNISDINGKVGHSFSPFFLPDPKDASGHHENGRSYSQGDHHPLGKDYFNQWVSFSWAAGFLSISE